MKARRKPRTPKPKTPRKPRYSAFREHAEIAIKAIIESATAGFWSPKRVRAALGRARADVMKAVHPSGSKATWARAVKQVAGTCMRGIPDRRQVEMFEGTGT